MNKKKIIRLSLRYRNKKWYISAPDFNIEISGALFIETIDRIYEKIEDELGLRFPLYELLEKPTTQFRFHMADTEGE